MIKDPKDQEWIMEGIDLGEIHSLTFSKKGGSVRWEAYYGLPYQARSHGAAKVTLLA